MSDIVKLIVGGHQFAMTKKMIDKHPNVLLARMLANDGNFKPVKVDDAYFFDRPGKLFESVMSYYYTDTFPEKVSEELSREFDYWGFEVAPTNPEVDEILVKLALGFMANVLRETNDKNIAMSMMNLGHGISYTKPFDNSAQCKLCLKKLGFDKYVSFGGNGQYHVSCITPLASPKDE